MNAAKSNIRADDDVSRGQQEEPEEGNPSVVLPAGTSDIAGLKAGVRPPVGLLRGSPGHGAAS